MMLHVTPDDQKTLITDIAPCGLNCRVCYAAMRKTGNRCPGCRGDDTHRAQSRVVCRIKTCSQRNENKKYCFSSDHYPCSRLRQLDDRYRRKYGMSVIENLDRIKDVGIRRFVRSENSRWICVSCGKKLYVHRADCLGCGRSWR